MSEPEDATDELRAAMDRLARDAEGALADADLYDELAPVYDFVSARRQDYGSIAAFVERHAPPDPSAVVVGACGAGRLLARLATDHETVLGFDRSPGMLELAATRTEAHLVRADLASFVAPDGFDVYTVLGGSIAHLPPGGPDEPDGVERLLGNAYESLGPGGVLVLEFMEQGTLESGKVVEQTFGSDRFQVSRTVVTTKEPDATDGFGTAARYTHAYEITDAERDETVRVGTSSMVREFPTGAMLGAAFAAGFDEATLAVPPTHGIALVARRL